MRFAGHKYTWTRPFMATRHSWELRGPKGAVQFNVSIMSDAERYPDPTCGLEFHHCFDPSGGGDVPAHIDCPLTGGRCWHEGTSLYASETIWPMVKGSLAGGDHDAVFSLLEHEYDKRFTQYESGVLS